MRYLILLIMKLGKIIIVLLMFFSAITSCTVENINSGKGYRNATVSWYGKKFNGKATASGEIYNMHKLTAAHKTLPFGTRVEIVNPATKRKVVVKITDRGPFVKGRDFDLSRKAFKRISSLDDGVINVKYKILR